MPRFRTLAGVEMSVDIATGTQTVQTPWGIVAIRAADVIVPDGTRTVPIPLRVWHQFFEPVVQAPVEASRVWPDMPFTEWLRKDLEDYARDVIGKAPPNFPRKGELAKWVAERVDRIVFEGTGLQSRMTGRVYPEDEAPGPLDVVTDRQGRPVRVPLREDGLAADEPITTTARDGVVRFSDLKES